MFAYPSVCEGNVLSARENVFDKTANVLVRDSIQDVASVGTAMHKLLVPQDTQLLRERVRTTPKGSREFRDAPLAAQKVFDKFQARRIAKCPEQARSLR